MGNPIQAPSVDYSSGTLEPAAFGSNHYQPQPYFQFRRSHEIENAKAPEANPLMFKGVLNPVFCKCPN